MRPGRGLNTPPSNAELKNAWSYTSNRPTYFTACQDTPRKSIKSQKAQLLILPSCPNSNTRLHKMKSPSHSLTVGVLSWLSPSPCSWIILLSVRKKDVLAHFYDVFISFLSCFKHYMFRLWHLTAIFRCFCNLRFRYTELITLFHANIIDSTN